MIPGASLENQVLLQLIKLTKFYGDLVAANHFNLELITGEVFGKNHSIYR